VTQSSWALLALAALLAIIDWWAAETGRRPIEIVAKPAVIVFLIGVALTLQPEHEVQRWLFVAGLAASLVGDVALLRADRRRWFAAGLAAFLAAHICYIAGLLVGPGIAAGAAGWVGLGIAAAVVGLGFWRVGRVILFVVGASRTASLARPVALYLGAISLLVLAAGASANPLAFAGAMAFYASDSLLGWDRFVAHVPHRGLLVMSTYHVAQALLVLSLAFG
jgi:uncharacterized membrane protein YhhN